MAQHRFKDSTIEGYNNYWSHWIDFCDDFRLIHEAGELHPGLIHHFGFDRLLIAFLQELVQQGRSSSCLRVAASAVVAVHTLKLSKGIDSAPRTAVFKFIKVHEDLNPPRDKVWLTFPQMEDLYNHLMSTGGNGKMIASIRLVFMLVVVAVARIGNILQKNRSTVGHKFMWNNVLTLGTLPTPVGNLSRAIKLRLAYEPVARKPPSGTRSSSKVARIRLVEKVSKNPIRTITFPVRNLWADFNAREFAANPMVYLRDRGGESITDILLILIRAYHEAYDSQVGNPRHTRIMFPVGSRPRYMKVKEMIQNDFNKELTRIGERLFDFKARYGVNLTAKVLRRSAMKWYSQILPKDILMFVVGHLGKTTLNQFYNGLDEEEKSEIWGNIPGHCIFGYNKIYMVRLMQFIL